MDKRFTPDHFDKVHDRIEKTHNMIFRAMPIVMVISIIGVIMTLALMGAGIYWLIGNAG